MSENLEMINLIKAYGQTRALDDVSLSVHEGEFFTLLGPSGSGKTTCLRIIAGLENPDLGDIRLRGRSLVGVPVHRRSIGMVFQNYALFPHRSVLQNVMYPLKMRRVQRKEAEAQAQRALDLVSLGELAQRRPHQLSGGQQQRVALARALVFKPPLLVLDEPLAALDRRLREQMQFELRRIHDELGTTMIYVTHDQAEAMAMSDRIAVLRDGRLEQVGTPQEVYEKSATRFVAEFLGEANILRMRVRETTRDGVILSDQVGRTMHVPKKAPKQGEVDIAIRAERISLSRPNGSEPSWLAEVREVVFLGDGIRYVLRCSPHTVVCRTPVAEGSLVHPPGSAVAIEWGLESALLYPVTDRLESRGTRA